MKPPKASPQIFIWSGDRGVIINCVREFTQKFEKHPFTSTFKYENSFDNELKLKRQ